MIGCKGRDPNCSGEEPQRPPREAVMQCSGEWVRQEEMLALGMPGSVINCPRALEKLLSAGGVGR